MIDDAIDWFEGLSTKRQVMVLVVYSTALLMVGAGLGSLAA